MYDCFSSGYPAPASASVYSPGHVSSHVPDCEMQFRSAIAEQWGTFETRAPDLPRRFAGTIGPCCIGLIPVLVDEGVNGGCAYPKPEIGWIAQNGQTTRSTLLSTAIHSSQMQVGARKAIHGYGRLAEVSEIREQDPFTWAHGNVDKEVERRVCSNMIEMRTIPDPDNMLDLAFLSLAALKIALYSVGSVAAPTR
ncbi:hypothetical protein M426DRAFT_18718 [Hypoxylon sp. CI-4A]|nr:hypothetical protein M426DRAFT_18718 [Hypoxylon sp. CI-4A]